MVASFFRVDLRPPSFFCTHPNLAKNVFPWFQWKVLYSPWRTGPKPGLKPRRNKQIPSRAAPRCVPFEGGRAGPPLREKLFGIAMWSKPTSVAFSF